MIKHQRYVSIFLMLLGLVIWGSTLWVRWAHADFLVAFPIYFSSAPNLGISMIMASALVFLGTFLEHKEVSLTAISYCALFTCFCQTISEIYYVLFAQGTFEWLDIAYGIFGLIIVLLVYYFL